MDAKKLKASSSGPKLQHSETDEKTKAKEQTDEALLIAELLDEEGDVDDKSAVAEKTVQHYKHLKYIRLAILLLIWLTFTIVLFLTKSTETKWTGIVVPTNPEGKQFFIPKQPKSDQLTLILRGPFQPDTTDIVEGDHQGNHFFHLRSLSPTIHKLIVTVEREFKNADGKLETETVSETLILSLVDPEEFDMLSTLIIERLHHFTLTPSTQNGGTYYYNFKLMEVNKLLALQYRSFPMALKTATSIALSFTLIFFMYVLFFWDVVSRGIVTMLFSTLAMALLGLYDNRPVLKEILNFIDLDTILLIFGLTLIICVVAETGGDQYLAVQAYRLSNGHIWPMLTVMCVVISFGAAFLDNTTIIILVASLALRLCEIMQLNATSVLTCLILFSNIGYMLTKSGLPEQAVLSQQGFIDSGYISREYGYYILQMLVPVIISWCLTYSYLRYWYGDSEKMRIIEPPIVTRLRNTMRLWQRTAQAVPGYTKEEAAVRQRLFSGVYRLRKRLRRLGKMPVPPENFKENLKRLEQQHIIDDRLLLIMCCIVLFGVVIMQVTNAFRLHKLSPGWICLLFSLVLLSIADWKDFESLMVKIDWSTLIAISCLYIITRALKPLGLVESMGDSITTMIRRTARKHRMSTAIILLICTTTLGSAFMDSSYVYYVMSSKALKMSYDENFDLALEPLILAVLLGAGFGHNATLVSGISNIVCAGIAEKHGFKFYFWDFFKIGFVVTIFNAIMSMIFMLIYNLIFGYN